jgi:hypothetical protein
MNNEKMTGNEKLKTTKIERRREGGDGKKGLRQQERGRRREKEFLTQEILEVAETIVSDYL